MENDVEVMPAEDKLREAAQARLIELTGEYYVLRDQYHCMALDPSAFNKHHGQMQSVLLAERLEEIAEETKKLVPVVYPQLEFKIGG
jgi:hypothetical protein